MCAARHQAGVHPHGGKQVGVLLAQHGRHGPTGRQARHINPRRVHRVVLHGITHHGRQQRGLAAAALLVFGAEPVPAVVGVAGLGLFGVQHQHTLLPGQCVHAGARGKVVRVLGAAV